MDLNDYLRTVFALLFVLGLIGLLYLLARQYAARRLGPGATRGGLGARLGIVEVRPLDGRRRLVLVRRDDVEHLLLLGPERDLVVESGVPARPRPDLVQGRPAQPDLAQPDLAQPDPAQPDPARARPPAPGRGGFAASLARAEDREPRL